MAGEEADVSSEVDSSQRFKLCDFFNNFVVELNPFLKQCKYCTFAIGRDCQRFRWHIACIEKQGARICREAPVHVKEAAEKLLFTVAKNSSPNAISAAVRVALLRVAVEIEAPNALDETNRDFPDDETAGSGRMNSSTEEQLFRGKFHLSAENTTLLEKALKNYPLLWPENKPELLTLDRYQKLLGYLDFIKDYKGVNKDSSILQSLHQQVKDLIDNGFDEGEILVISYHFRSDNHGKSYLDTRRVLEEQLDSLQRQIRSKKEEVELLEEKATRAWRKLKDYELHYIEF